MQERERPILLIVDDEPANIKVLCGLLKNDYELRAANNGEKALALARSERPDLVLLDVKMPGIDGYEVCRRIKADPATNKIPVILVTGSMFDEEGRGASAGAVDFVAKPYSAEVIKARIRAHLPASR